MNPLHLTRPVAQTPRRSQASGPSLTLVERLAAREPRAIDEFYRLYRERILAVAHRVVGNPWDAEEVLQDVAWIVQRKVEGFRGDAEFSSWLYRVTQNCAKMLLRKRKRVPLPMQHEHLEPALARSNPGQPDLVEAMAQHQLAQEVQQQINQLDGLNRAIFLATAVEGEPASEVGQRLGLSVLAVKSRLFRIRATLRVLPTWSDEAGRRMRATPAAAEGTLALQAA